MHTATNQIMHHNLQKVLGKLIESPSVSARVDERHQGEMVGRNWAFDNYLAPRIVEYAQWLELSDEHANYTYSIKNLHHLAGWVSCVTRSSTSEAMAVIEEIISDAWLVDYLADLEGKAASFSQASRIKNIGGGIFGRRIGWYAVARLKKPKLIVETGVDRGLGSVALCRALMRNSEEGAPGHYIGTDINPHAGYLLAGPLSQVGRIVYGDSVETLSRLAPTVDLFINDSDHSAEYEAREYATISGKLGMGAVVLGDNSHVTDKLYRFSVSQGMSFLHFSEQPEGHWYPGAGIGAAF